MSNYPVTPVVLKNWYDEYNKKYFDGMLPDATVCNFQVRNYQAYGKISYPKTVRGKKRDWIISESSYYEIDEENRRHTMLHEMCHLWCYVNGCEHEGHGPHWKAIAGEISRKSGFDIKRLHPGSFHLSDNGKEKRGRLLMRTQKAYPMLVYPHGKNAVIIVKTTASALRKGIIWRNNAYRVNAQIQPESFFLSDCFPDWIVRKSVNRGTLMLREQYEEEVLPLLIREGKEFDSAQELLRAAL